MKKAQNSEGIGFFQKYLSLWVAICMAVGVLIGKFLPGISAFLNQFEYAKVSIPMAILIWLMIYPMMIVFVNLKVEQKGFQKVSTCQHRQFRGSPCRAAG